MATARCAAFAVGNIVTLATVPLINKLKVKSLTIDNQGAANHTIYLRDDFTTDSSAGTPIPITPTVIKGQWTVGAGLTASIPKEELEGKEFLGTLKCYADGAEPACIITADYEFV